MTSPPRTRTRLLSRFVGALRWTPAVAALVAAVVTVGVVWNRSNTPTSSDTEASSSDGDVDQETGVGDALRRIDGLDGVDTSIFALGSVWAVTSERADEFTVVRIEPTTGHVEPVLESPGSRPTFSDLEGRLWVSLSDRIVALDSSGSEVAMASFAPGRPGDHVAGRNHLWVVDFTAATVSVIDPDTARIVRTIETGASPVHPISAFGHVWIPSITDGTVTIISDTAPADTTVIEPFLSSDRLSTVSPTAVPDGLTGDEVWVTNVEGEIFAITAEGDAFGQVRPVEVDSPVYQIYVQDRRVFLLPAVGHDVLVLDLDTDELVTRIPTDSVPLNATIAHDLLWVAGDGPREILTVIDPRTLTVRHELSVGANDSSSTGPQRPLEVDDEIWVPNQGDGAFFIVDVEDV